MFSATEFVYVERNANSQDVSLDHVKNPTMETKIGDRIHRSENTTQFVRAEICDGSVIVRYVGRARRRTFHEPLQLYRSRIHRALDPLILPCEELDEFDLKHCQLTVLSLKGECTAPTSSFITAIRLSLLVKAPFWIRVLRFMRYELSGHPTIKTRKLRKADQPRY